MWWAMRRNRTSHICTVCRVLFELRPCEVRRGQGRFCSRACMLTTWHGTSHPAWRGGLTRSERYVIANAEGKREHVVVAERALGKALPPGAIVHHFNNDGTDNSNRNLVIGQDQAYHMLLHALDRVRRAGGRPFLDKICHDCREVKPVTEFSPGVDHGRPRPASKCKACAAAWQRERRRRTAA